VLFLCGVFIKVFEALEHLIKSIDNMYIFHRITQEGGIMQTLGILVFLIGLILLPIFIIFFRKTPWRKNALAVTAVFCGLGLIVTIAFAPRSEVTTDAGQEATSKGQPYEITKLKTSWDATGRGLTALDGMLWVPEIRIFVKNIAAKDKEDVFFKVLFLDAEQVIKGDEVIERIGSIPAGYTKGPIFFQGTVGYTSDLALVEMAKDTLKKWRYDFFESGSYSGPWRKIRSGSIDLPTPYNAIK